MLADMRAFVRWTPPPRDGKTAPNRRRRRRQDGGLRAIGPETRHGRRRSMADDHTDSTRRDFLYYATAGAGDGRGRCGRLAAGQPDEPVCRRAGAGLDPGRRLGRDRRHAADGPVAGQAGLHPLPHAGGDRGRAGRRRLAACTDPNAENANLDGGRAGDGREPRAARTGRRGGRIEAVAGDDRASAPTSAACRWAKRAISAAGSAPATARTTTPPAGSAKDRRRVTCRSRSRPSSTRPRIQLG